MMRAAPVALAMLAVLALGACSAGSPGWVTEVAAASERADQAIADGRLDDARRELEAALALPVPEEIADPDADIVRKDILCRLSGVELADGDPASAADRADEGLNLGLSDDVFTAGLLVARGRAREALGRPREAAGDYFDALEIDERLLSEALGEEEEGER